MLPWHILNDHLLKVQTILWSERAYFERNSQAQHFLDDSGTRSCVMSVLNNYLLDYYALHTAFLLHLYLLAPLPLLLHP